MKTWKRPEAVGQEFAANEYVSACTLTLNCSVTSSELYANFCLAVPAEAPAEFLGGEYWGCGAAVSVPLDKLEECTFTHIADANEYHGDTKLENPVEAYYWVGTKANGDPDFHAFPATADLKALVDSGNKS